MPFSEWRQSFESDDLILEVNRDGVGTVEEFNDALSSVDEGEPVLLLLRRGETTFYTAVKMPSRDDQD